MSFQSVDKKFESVNTQEIPEEGPINFTEIIIPFSKFGASKSKSDIYNGSEKVPFSQRISVYKTILENEFSDKKCHEIS
ncbi:MAG: hypothetical protein ACFFB6_13660 [Promethearchaeota archaeon]